MNHSTNIRPKDIQHYLKDIKKQLLLTHSRKETTSIIEMLQVSITEFLEDNPTATIEDLKTHFSDYTSLNDMELYNIDSKILEEKLNYSRTIKRIVAVTLFLVVLAFIIYVVLYVKSYIDVQNSIDAYKVIEIN
ncbi:hypothetical protein CC1_24400 [Coprococcus catus GD/7]|nr:hypothetical protein [Coprococcus catus]MEE0142258.1 hypothetical protein [Coprococcus sp.]CBK81095.1 hypothetical protein CC1_24400 [Coprococcus catus GD/7]